MAVAVQAPAHRKRFLLVNDVHMVDLTVATDAADPAIDVHGMIEIREIRYLMNLDPVNWIAGIVTLMWRSLPIQIYRPLRLA